MQNEEYFVCVSEECTQHRILNDWQEIVAHQSDGHEVLLKEDLIDTINRRISSLKSTLFSDLLAKIHKIMINAEDNMIAKINQQFTETYQFWKEKLNTQVHQAEFLLPNDLDNDTPVRRLVEIYQNLQNDQLHYFKDCIYQVDEAFTTLQQQINIQLVKTDQQLKQVVQSLYTRIQINKTERELQQPINKPKSRVEIQETREQLNENISQGQSIHDRSNQRLDKTNNTNQESIQIENYFKSSQKQKQQIRAPSEESPESRQRPLRGYKDYQQQQNFEDSINSQYVEQFYRRNPHSPVRDFQRVSEIIYEKPISPPKLPPPLRGYKERQTEPGKVVIQRSNDRRQYIDELLMQDILVLTQKKFDLDRSDKHMKYSNKFGTIFCPKECFAIVEGSFTLSQHRQINIFLRAEGMNYEISVGIANLTQIIDKNMFPDVYGINKQGESLSTQTMTPIRLLPEKTYLLAYRHDQHLLIVIDSASNMQHPIQLPQDQSSEFVFFVRMNNVQVSLI